MNNILITGASGFIGGSLTKYLAVKFPKKNILALYNKNKPVLIYSNIKLLKQDLTKENILKKLPKKIEAIIHCAGERQAFLKGEEATKQLIDNSLMANNICKYAKNINCKKIIFFSSIYIYSNSVKLPFNEKNLNIPKENLGLSKYISEQIFKNSLANNLNSVVSLRVSTVYGKNSNQKQFIPSLINKINDSSKTINLYNGNIKRDYINISDVNDAIFKLLKIMNKKIKNYNNFNLGSGKSYRVFEVTNILLKEMNINKKILYQNKLKLRLGDISHELNISKIKKILNWSPKISIKKGLREII